MEGDFIPLDSPSSSSKRAPKGKRGDGEGSAATLFVSSLPYDATTTDLTTHFSFVGPIRHGFVATDKETGKSKGVGYVTFALKEDAERALTELDGSVFGAKGRKIRVTLADRKVRSRRETVLTLQPGREIQEARPAKKPRVSAVEAAAPAEDSDPNAIRTLVITGLPADLTKAVLWKKIRKADDRAEIEYPVEGQERTANVVFPSHGDALRALPKLHGHTYKGSLLSAVLKKRLDKLSAKGEGRAQSHAGRLIIRNLAWDTTEADLRATFLPFGPIQAIDLPTAPSKLPTEPGKAPPPPRARGFAFVWFMVRNDAQRAMDSINGKPIIRAPDAANAVGKGKGKKVEVGEGRPVAVDWAMSKEKWQEREREDEDETKEEKEEKEEEEEEEGEEEDNEESGSSRSGSGSDDSEGEDDDGEDVEMDDNENEDDGENDEEEDNEEEEAPVKPKLPDTDVGSTLFIRNLPFEVTEQELGSLFRTFGPMRYARITMDKATGRSRGTGFVCFWNIKDADAAIAESERVASETGANAIPVS
jgi:nucleolar protein 4